MVAEETSPTLPQQTTRRPFRVEMVLAQLYVGGMEIMVVNLMRHLRRRGYDVGLTCIEEEGNLFARVASEGFRTRVVPAVGALRLLSPRPLISWFREIRPQAVHIHSGAWIKGAIGARRAGVPRIIYTHHGLEQRESFFDSVMNRYAARYTDQMVAVSEELQRRMEAEGGLRANDIAVIPNGISIDRFTPEGPVHGLRKRFGISGETRIIGNVARMWPVKNQLGLIDAFALVRSRFENACLMIVGDGDMRPAIEQRVADHDLTDHVHFTGEMDDLEGVYREFDIFALSSFSEGMSISILEAMASGTCVVATDVGGNRELLGDGDHGVIVPDLDPATMADSLCATLLDDGLRQRLASSARSRVIENFSDVAMGERYERLYTEAVHGHATIDTVNKENPACVG